jgi:hypothetical protein
MVRVRLINRAKPGWFREILVMDAIKSPNPPDGTRASRAVSRDNGPSARLHLYGNGHPGTMLVGGPQSTR